MATWRVALALLVVCCCCGCCCCSAPYFWDTGRSADVRPVVISLAYSYNWNKIRVFVTSLRDTGYDGELVLLMQRDLDELTRTRLLQYNVTYYPVSAEWPYFECCVDPVHLRKVPPMKLPITSTRYLLAELFLMAHGSRFTHVLLSDSNDVYFQRDPFDWAIEDKLYVFIEHRRILIGNCPYNQRYLLPYGLEVLRSMLHLPVSCSGTTYGSLEMMRYYLKLMREEFYAHRFSPHLTMATDQGHHIYVIHRREWPEGRLHMFDNMLAPVRTVAYEVYQGDHQRLNERYQLLNFDETISPVVHQYNRSPDLVRVANWYYFRPPHTDDMPAPDMRHEEDRVIFTMDDGNLLNTKSVGSNLSATQAL